MSLTTRLAEVLSGAAARVEGIARSLRGPEQTRVATVPGSMRYGVQPDAKTQGLLRSWGIYESRIAPEAGPTRTRWALWPGDALTPEIIIGAQRDAVTSGIPLRWVELVDQIYSRDGHYAAVTSQRVEDCIKGTWRLTRATPDEPGTAVRNFVAEAYGACSRWRDGLGWLLFSNLYAYNSVEVEWEARKQFAFPGPKGETIVAREVAVPKRLHNVHPKHYRFDIETDDPLFWIGNTYQPLSFVKFVFLDGEGLHPIKLRRGHAWQCIWYSLFRSIGWAGWATFVDRFGMPMPIIQYEGELAQYEEYQSAYTDILNSLGQGKGAILPRNGAEIEIKDPPQGGRSNDPHSALSDACDAGQSIRVLGATLTAKIGNVGSFAASETHAEVKYAKEENDVGRLWERIDEQLTTPLVVFNAEPLADALKAAGYDVTPDMITRRIPKGKHRVPRESDPFVELQIADIAVNKLGLPLSEEGMLDRIDWPRALSPEDRVKGEVQVVAKGGALIANAEGIEGGEAAKNPDDAALAAVDQKQEESDHPPPRRAPGAKKEAAETPTDASDTDDKE